MARTIEIGMLEYMNTMIVHEKMEVDLDHWPELNGMSEDEAMEYIKENSYKMKPTPDSGDWASSLYDELMEMDVVREKEYGYSTDIYND